MKKICMTCAKEFTCGDNETWKKQCYDCYKNFKGTPRIEILKPHKGIHLHSHPDVTKEEVDQFIEKKLGSVNCPENWGAVEVGGKLKLWWNCQDTD